MYKHKDSKDKHKFMALGMTPIYTEEFKELNDESFESFIKTFKLFITKFIKEYPNKTQDDLVYRIACNFCHVKEVKKEDFLEKILEHLRLNPEVVSNDEPKYENFKATLKGFLTKYISNLDSLLDAIANIQIKIVGRGATAEVYHIKDKDNEGHDINYALKQFKVGGTSDEYFFNCFTAEKGIHSSLKHHENILQLLKVDVDKRVFYLEYCEYGSLESYLKKNPKTIGIIEKAEYMSGAAKGLAYLHDYDIVHRDIKPANLLVDENKTAKWADFGCADRCKRTEDGKHLLISKDQGHQAAGTTRYLSLEAMKYLCCQARHSYFGDKSDIVSFMLTCYFLMTEERPFKEYNINNNNKNDFVMKRFQKQLKLNVDDCDKKVELSKLNKHEERLLVSIKSLIGRGLVHEEEKRPSANEIAEELTNEIQNQMPSV